MAIIHCYDYYTQMFIISLTILQISAHNIAYGASFYGKYKSKQFIPQTRL